MMNSIDFHKEKSSKTSHQYDDLCDELQKTFLPSNEQAVLTNPFLPSNNSKTGDQIDNFLMAKKLLIQVKKVFFIN